MLSLDVLAIPRGSKHVKEAFQFIRYVQRQDVMEGLCIAHGECSPLEKASAHFFKVHPNPYIRLFDKLARSPKAFGSVHIGLWHQLNDEIGVAFQKVSDLSATQGSSGLRTGADGESVGYLSGTGAGPVRRDSRVGVLFAMPWIWASSFFLPIR